MYKVFCLLIKRHQEKNKIWFFRTIVILFAFLSVSMITAQPLVTVSLERIHQLEINSSGNIQKRYRAWGKLIDSLRNQPIEVQLTKVNDFFNQFQYESDMEARGVEDYWKSPEEFIEDGGGDCEDYALIKYFTLIVLGVPTERLRITYVISTSLKQAHMVLAYYATPEAEPLILDSLDSKILKASLRPDLKPVYSFNGEGLWMAKERGQNLSLGKPSSLSKWNDLLKRMQQQGDIHDTD